ncbi:MAG: hypothetical protein ACFCU3_04775 [Verrucomicrobiales bacterium]
MSRFSQGGTLLIRRHQRHIPDRIYVDYRGLAGFAVSVETLAVYDWPPTPETITYRLES